MGPVSPTTKTGKVHRCKFCSETFDTPQKLGTHTFGKHPESRRAKHGRRVSRQNLALEITVRMRATPSEMTRIEIPARNAVELEGLYRQFNKYIADRAF